MQVFPAAVSRMRDLNLHPTTVTFADVSHVTYSSSLYGPTRTQFDFTVGSKREYSVSIADEVRPHNGMTVTALLREPGNWQTLVGWIDHKSGKVSGVSSPASQCWVAVSCVLPFILVPQFFMPLFGTGEWKTLPPVLNVFLVIFVLLATGRLRSAWKSHRTLKVLRRLRQRH